MQGSAVYYPTPTLVLSPCLSCPLAVGCCRCPQVRDQAPSFTSVTDAVTYASAKQAVDKAESAEAQALAAAVALEATLQADAEAEAELDALDVRMGKKAKTVEAIAAPDAEADDMRAALEVAMLRATEASEAEAEQEGPAVTSWYDDGKRL